jgi:hypothetical protein
VAGIAGGTEREEGEVVEEDQGVEKNDGLTDDLLAELRNGCVKHPVRLWRIWILSCSVAVILKRCSVGACEL